MFKTPKGLFRVDESGARLLLLRGGDAEVFVCEARGGATARRSVEEADLNQVRLDDLFNGVLLLLQGGGHVREADGAALVLLNNHQEELSVHLVEAEGVNLHAIERIVGDLFGDAPVVLDLRVVAHASQKSVGDARCAARAARNLACAAVVNFGVEYVGGAADDCRKLFVRVEVEVEGYAEATAKGGGYQTRSRRRADECELRQFQFYRARRSPLPDHYVELI